jgi:hypothetical protein
MHFVQDHLTCIHQKPKYSSKSGARDSREGGEILSCTMMGRRAKVTGIASH